MVTGLQLAPGRNPKAKREKNKNEFNKLKRPALHLHHTPPNGAEWTCYRPAACRERWRKISWSSDLSNLPQSFTEPRVGVNTKPPLPTHAHTLHPSGLILQINGTDSYIVIFYGDNTVLLKLPPLPQYYLLCFFNIELRQLEWKLGWIMKGRSLTHFSCHARSWIPVRCSQSRTCDT